MTSRQAMQTLHQALAALLLFILHHSLAATCNPPRGGVLPLMPHCTELVHKILDISRSPHGMAIKEWGRTLDNTPTTVHLPKTYWIAGDGPRTCAVLVDVDSHNPTAVERFNLGELGHAAEHVENWCLFRKSQVGAERVGVGKKVEVRLERADLSSIPTTGTVLLDAHLGPGLRLLSWEPGSPEETPINGTATEKR
ncbi:MAG: hypothetical protein Q9222_000866 [Ikaeria aurantiellina]